jgi:hypothetical protein
MLGVIIKGIQGKFVAYGIAGFSPVLPAIIGT